MGKKWRKEEDNWKGDNFLEVFWERKGELG
jgi:hypothetical protein